MVSDNETTKYSILSFALPGKSIAVWTLNIIDILHKNSIRNGFSWQLHGYSTNKSNDENFNSKVYSHPLNLHSWNVFQAQLYQQKKLLYGNLLKAYFTSPVTTSKSIIWSSYKSYVNHLKPKEYIQNYLINVPVDKTIFLQISHSSCKILRNTVIHPKPIWKCPILFITHITNQSKSPSLPTSLAPESQFLKNYPIITTHKHLHKQTFQLQNTLSNKPSNISCSIW